MCLSLSVKRGVEKNSRCSSIIGGLVDFVSYERLTIPFEGLRKNDTCAQKRTSRTNDPSPLFRPIVKKDL